LHRCRELTGGGGNGGKRTAKDIENQLKSAQRRGDAAAMMSIIFSLNKKSDSDIIRELFDDIEFYYWQFLDNFPREPRSIGDLIDGIIYLELKSFFERRASERALQKGK
jgi:hypothetical protein